MIKGTSYGWGCLGFIATGLWRIADAAGSDDRSKKIRWQAKCTIRTGMKVFKEEYFG